MPRIVRDLYQETSVTHNVGVTLIASFMALFTGVLPVVVLFEALSALPKAAAAVIAFGYVMPLWKWALNRSWFE